MGLFASASVPADARIVIEGNRAIYPAASKEISVRAKNHADVPALAQVWVTEYEVDADPEASRAPFAALPPLVRIGAGKTQVFRIRHIGAELPQDRESVFWLNVLDMPGHSSEAGSPQSEIRIAVRNRIKLFYRPEALKGQAAGDAIGKLQWSLVPQGHSWALQVRNDSPFHVNTVSAALLVGGKRIEADKVGIIKPKAVQQFAVPGLKARPANAEVTFKFVTEYGSAAEETVSLALD